MATCGSLGTLYENPLPENPTLIESLTSWNHHKPAKPVKVSSLAEIFGELDFHEKPSPTIAPQALEQVTQSKDIVQANEDSSSKSVSKNLSIFDRKCSSGSLQMCTEGLGSESSDDVDDLMESGDNWRSYGKCGSKRQLMYSGSIGYPKSVWGVKASKKDREFPPPISSIGKSGKPCVCLKSYREDGRFVLKEIRIPNQELLRASREDGRLKLHFVRPNENIEEGEEGEEEEDDDEVGKIEEGDKIVDEGENDH